MMSLKEAMRLALMQDVDSKNLTLREAAVKMGLSLRQTKRIRQSYQMNGAVGLISKRRGKVSPNRTDPSVKMDVINILSLNQYSGFGPTFASEKLKEHHGISLSNETVRQWMMEGGLWRGKRAKLKRVYQRRARRSRFGDMLQGDGSRHAWFEDRGEKSTLLLFVDDATSRICVARFTPAESTEGYLLLLEDQLKKHGKPLALYTDKHSSFRVNQEGHKNRLTHFAQVLKELDIELICANSPQAKGRVERTNGTLQDRLIKEMRLRGISTIEEANEYLPHFIEEYNNRFGKKPREEEDAHRPLKKSDNLERLFAHRSVRKLSKDLSFHYNGEHYQLQPNSPNRFRKTYIEILDRPGKPILIESDGKSYAYTSWGKMAAAQPKILDCKELEAYWPTREYRRQSKHHPWRS
jgi:hypothetical protein